MVFIRFISIIRKNPPNHENQVRKGKDGNNQIYKYHITTNQPQGRILLNHENQVSKGNDQV